MERFEQVIAVYLEYLEKKLSLLERLQDMTSNLERIININDQEDRINEILSSRQVVMDKIDILDKERAEIIMFFKSSKGETSLKAFPAFLGKIKALENDTQKVLKVIFEKNKIVDTHVRNQHAYLGKKLREVKQSKKVNNAYESQYSSAPEGIYFDKKK